MNVAASPSVFAERVSGLVYCVGAQKAGTTWLHAQLVARPNVFARVKEVHYWDVRNPPYIGWDGMGFVRPQKKRYPWSDDPPERHEMFRGPRGDHAAYVQYISKGAPDGATVLDVTPSYALLPARIYKEMAGLHPDTRFVFLVRDPVARLWSGVKHRYRRLHDFGAVTEDDLAAAFSDALDDDYDPDYRRSRYDLTIDALLSAVPRDRVLVHPFEAMVKGGNAALARFLDVPEDGLQASEARNVGTARSARLPEDLAARAYARLAPAYDRVEAMLGGRPEGWRTDETMAQRG
jgi:hypothetical protein